MIYLISYLIAGIGFVAYDSIFNKALREVFQRHPVMVPIQILRWPVSLFNRARNNFLPKSPAGSGFKGNDSSFYRRWVAKHEQELQKKEKMDDPMIFAGMIMFIGNFDPFQNRILIEPLGPSQLGDDASLFEMGCYLLSDINIWMTRKFPSKQENFMHYVRGEFIQLSSAALAIPLEDVEALLNEREKQYAKELSLLGDPREVLSILASHVQYAAKHGKCWDKIHPPQNPIDDLDLSLADLFLQVQNWVLSSEAAIFGILTKHFNDQLNTIELAQAHICPACNEAIAAMEADKYADAIQKLSAVIENDRQHSEAFYLRGKAYRGQGGKCFQAEERADNFSSALNDFKTHMRLLPNSAMAFSELGQMQFICGDKNSAIPNLEKAVSLNPKDDVAWLFLARTRNKATALQAVKEITTAIEINGKRAIYFSERARFLGLLGQHEKAICDFTTAIDLEPRNSSHYYWRSQAYKRVGRQDLAEMDAQLSEKYED